MNYTVGEPLLTLEEVNLDFKGEKVLRDINMQVCNIHNYGQVMTLLGRSGVGKTQLMKMIAGLSKPTSGRILVGPEQVPVEPGRVGMVLQTYPLFQHRTLKENLELVSKDKEKIDFYLNEFDVYDRKDNYPCQLSGGQRQRTAIVQQLLCSEQFILLDEPFSGLDPVATDKLCANISKVVNLDEHNTVIISTHILSPAMAISDRVVMLGYEYQEEKIPGAIVKHDYDLAALGLAWRPEIRKDPIFQQLTENIRDLFIKL